LILQFSISGHEVIVFPDGRTIVNGTTDIGLARALVARIISF